MTEEVQSISPILDDIFNFHADNDWHLEYFVMTEMVKLAQKPLEELTDEEVLLIKRHVEKNPLFAMFFAGKHQISLTITEDPVVEIP